MTVIDTKIDVDWFSIFRVSRPSPANVPPFLFREFQPVKESRDTCLVSRHGFSCLSLGSVSTHVCLLLARVSCFHVSSCLTTRDCVLTESLLGIPK